MKNGLYAAAFETPMGMGTGVVVLENGTFKGGDATMFYVGNYNEANGSFTATMKVARHSSGGQNVFGRDTVNVTLNGTASGEKINAKGQAKEVPGVSFSAILTFLSE